ncbi:PREDICTED: probable 4-coumarate--CoA ligase 5 isoform X2 [Priapulus caudatus]|nr:PREDICTED: probable 4-coumarate--CoA ligase 5 isoform X2 [Priapulus caudatus]XP_014669245.1 PREDICTED: probable 4-coumarate--CoA ligase 5 isoform X2 [Priapulus caudatus]
MSVLRVFQHMRKCRFAGEGKPLPSRIARRYATSDGGPLDSRRVLTSDTAMPDIPAYSNYAEAMLAMCEHHGDSDAFVDADTGRALTFRDVRDLTLNLAARLRADGFRPGDVLAVVAPNEIEFVAPLLAAPSLGGALTAVNPSLTPGDYKYQIETSGATYAMSHPASHSRLMEALHGNTAIRKMYSFGDVDGCMPLSALSSPDDDFKMAFVDVADAVAALPFSSGTTGRPKAVMLTHRNLLSNVYQCTHPDYLHLTRDHHCLSILPNFHAYGFIVILRTLFTGATTVTSAKFDPTKYLETIKRRKINYLYTVPPIINLLAKHPAVSNYDLSSVETILSGAAALGVELSKQLMERVPSVKCLQQGWGMTELSPVGLATSPVRYKMGTVGKVVPGTEIVVVSPETGQALPAHEPGELWLRGPQVMKGYLNNDVATRETINADGWLRSGDVGYYDDDNVFVISDRMKELIKVKGYQVAPAELESVISGHPGVADVAVIGIPDERSGELPKAFVVKKVDSLTADDIINFTNEKVAHFKQLKGGVEFLTEIPKSESGKILRRLLR